MIYRRGKLFIRLATIGFVSGIIFALILMSGCETVTPYYEAGIGYALPSGEYHARIGAPEDQSIFFVELDERCAIGTIALGVELEYNIDVELRHTSCFNQSPEISANTIMIQKRGYFK